MATKSMFSRATALLAAASMAASGLVEAPAFATGADPANNIDQQPVDGNGVGLDCTLDAYPGGVLVNTGSSDDAEATAGLLTGTTQTFTPSIGNVSSIDLCLSVIVGGEEVDNLLREQVSDLFTFDVTVYTGDAPTSEDVVTRTTAELSLLEVTSDLGLAAAWFNVQLADANLQPGSPYTIEITDPSVTFVWRTTCGGDLPAAPSCEGAADAYPEGASGADAAADHGFRTRFEVGGNLTGSVAAPSLVCPDLATLSALLVSVQNGAVGVAPFEVDLALVDGETTTQLGTAEVRALSAYEGIVLGGEEFGVPAPVWAAAADLAAEAGRRVQFQATIDARQTVTEVNEDDNVHVAGTTLISCAPSELSPTAFVVDQGQDVPTVEHGITALPFTTLTPGDIAAGAEDLNVLMTSMEEGVNGEYVYGSPAYGAPAYGAPAYGAPAYGAPAYGAPAYGAPAYGAPAYGAPAYGAPAYGAPAYGAPAYGAPAYGAPAYGAPAYGAPGYALDLVTLFESLGDDILQQIPLVSSPIEPSWQSRLETYKDTYPENTVVDQLLQLPSQDRTLFDVLRRLDPPLLVRYNEADFSNVMPLSMLSVGLANIRLGDFAYDRTPGITHECELLEQTSHLTCADVIELGLVPADLTLLQLPLIGYDPSYFPLVVEPAKGLHDLRVRTLTDGEGNTHEQTGNVLFDVYLANTGFLDLRDDLGFELEDFQAYAKLRHTPHGQELINELFADVDAIVNCNETTCDATTTIADVEQDFAFVKHATVADFLEALRPEKADLFTVADTLLALHAITNLPLGQFGMDQQDLPRLTGNTCPSIPMHLDATSVGGAPVVDPIYTVQLATGWDLVPGTVQVLLDGVAINGDHVVTDSDEHDRTTVFTVATHAIVTGDIRISFEACASVDLGVQSSFWTGVEYDSFVSATDLAIETIELIDPTEPFVGTAVVVEQTEPDEASDRATRVIAPNTMVHRHITGPTDVDQFVIPVGSDLGDGVTLEEGDFLYVFMAPPKNELVHNTDTGEYEPFGNNDFDMAMFVTGATPVVDNLFGEGDEAWAGTTEEEGILPLSSPEPGIDAAYSTLQAAPAYGAPAYGAPAYGAPAYGAAARVLSNNRGDQMEYVFTEVLPGWADGETDLTIQVSGNLGAASDEPYVLWYLVMKDLRRPVQCIPPHDRGELEAALDAAGTVPTLAPGTESVIFYNEDLYALEFGDVAASELGTSLAMLADHELVNGVVVDLMDDPAYRAAMLDYLTSDAWCRVEAANLVHGAARDVVQRLGDQTATGTDGPTLEYVVTVGGDDKHPFARLKDTTTLANELEHFASIARAVGSWNPLTAAHSRGFLLSDDPMVTRNPKPWSDEYLWLPDYVSSRLYGSATDVQVQIGEFFASQGVVTVGNSVVTGEDFMADGGFHVRDFLRSIGVTVNEDLLHAPGTPFEELSSAADLVAALSNKAPEGEEADYADLTLLFQHADQSNLQSAKGTAGRYADVVSTADYDGQNLSFGSVVAGTICHFGQDVPRSFIGLGDELLPEGVLPTGAETWTGTLARDRINSYMVAHTSYGYGVSEGRDLSEELVNLMVEFAASGLSWGEATRAAKVRYHATSSEYGEHQRKVISTLTGSGMPWVTTLLPEASTETATLSTASFTANSHQSRVAMPTTVVPTFQTDPVTGLQMTELVVPSLTVARGEGCTECLWRNEVGHVANTDSGVFYDVETDFAIPGVEGREGRPIGPKTTTVYELEPGQVIGGVVVTAITSEPAPGRDGDPERVDFVNATSHVSSTIQEAPVQSLDVATGGPFANVRPVDDTAYVTIPRYSARGIGIESDAFGPDVVGSYRLDTALDGDVYLRDPNAPETLPAQITDLDVVRVQENTPDRETLGITVTAMDQSALVRAVVGVLVDGTWQFRDMGPVSSDPNTGADGAFTTAVFSTGISVTKDAPVDSLVMYIVDEWGTVATDEVKGQRIATLDGAVTNPADDPELTITGELVEGWYKGEATVTIEGEAGQVYKIVVDGELTHVRFDGPTYSFIEDQSGYHEVRVTKLVGGGEASAIFAVDNSIPEVFIHTPNEAADETPTFVSGSVVPVDHLCRDAGGGVADEDCVVDPANTVDLNGILHVDTSRITEGPLPEITVTATDLVGNTASKSVAFRVISAFQFIGFDDPVKDVFDGNGAFLGQEYVASGENTVPFKFQYLTRDGTPIGLDGTLSFYWTAEVRAGEQIAEGEPTACDAVSKPGYRYRNGAHQFTAVTSCFEYDFQPGDIWRFTVEAPDGLKLEARVIVN